MAQSPDRLSYQAIVRNASGNVVANQSVGMRIAILKGSATGASVYVETQTRNTNASGLITLEIGGGIPVTGSFALVNWGQGPYFIKTETDVTGGTNYQLTGTTQLLSVPYSLYASDIPISKDGDTVTIGKTKLVIPGAVFIPGSMPPSVNDGLVAYYPFTGNASDSSGNGNHGTAIGISLVADRFGNPNRAYQFAGTSGSYIDVPITNSLRIQRSVSISCWAYMDGGSINPRILSVVNTASCESLYMAVMGTLQGTRKLDALFANTNCTNTQINGVDVPALKWVHLTFTVDSSGLSKFYLNGNLVKTQNGSIINDASYGTNLNIGRKAASSFDAWGGRLDELRIYNRALRADEINALYFLR